MQKKPSNNIEMLVDYMEWGSAMNQLFVIEAVRTKAEAVVANEADVLKAMENNFIYGPAWVQAAKDYLKKSEEFYNRFDKSSEEGEKGHPFKTDPEDWDSCELFDYLQEQGVIDDEDIFEFNAPDRCDMIKMIYEHIEN